MAMKKATARRGRERRVNERAEARLSMRVDAGATGGAARIVTESQNISASGVYSHASHYLAPLSKVQLTIVLPRTPGTGASSQELVKCDGIVVRCDQRAGDRSETPYELACMFTGLQPELRRRIEEFVTWRNLQALRLAMGQTTSEPRSAARKPVAVRKAVPRRVTRPKTTTARAKSAVRASAPKPARKSAGRTRG